MPIQQSSSFTRASLQAGDNAFLLPKEQVSCQNTGPHLGQVRYPPSLPSRDPHTTLTIALPPWLHQVQNSLGSAKGILSLTDTVLT